MTAILVGMQSIFAYLPRLQSSLYHKITAISIARHHLEVCYISCDLTFICGSAARSSCTEVLPKWTAATLRSTSAQNDWLTCKGLTNEIDYTLHGVFSNDSP